MGYGVEFYNPNGTTFYANTSELPVNSSYRGVYLPNGRNTDGGYGNALGLTLNINVDNVIKEINYKSRYFVLGKINNKYILNNNEITEKNNNEIIVDLEDLGIIPSNLDINLNNQGIVYDIRNNVLTNENKTEEMFIKFNLNNHIDPNCNYIIGDVVNYISPVLPASSNFSTQEITNHPFKLISLFPFGENKTL